MCDMISGCHWIQVGNAPNQAPGFAVSFTTDNIKLKYLTSHSITIIYHRSSSFIIVHNTYTHTLSLSPSIAWCRILLFITVLSFWGVAKTIRTKHDAIGGASDLTRGLPISLIHIFLSPLRLRLKFPSMIESPWKYRDSSPIEYPQTINLQNIPFHPHDASGFP